MDKHAFAALEEIIAEQRKRADGAERAHLAVLEEIGRVNLRLVDEERRTAREKARADELRRALWEATTMTRETADALARVTAERDAARATLADSDRIWRELENQECRHDRGGECRECFVARVQCMYRTADRRIAELTAERDAGRAARVREGAAFAAAEERSDRAVAASLEMANRLDATEKDREALIGQGSAAESAFDKIAALCGCPEWEYPGQVVRDVEALALERDVLRKCAEALKAERDEARLVAASNLAYAGRLGNQIGRERAQHRLLTVLREAVLAKTVAREEACDDGWSAAFERAEAAGLAALAAAAAAQANGAADEPVPRDLLDMAIALAERGARFDRDLWPDVRDLKALVLARRLAAEERGA